MDLVKNIPLYDVRPISSLKEMLRSSVAAFGEKPAFLSRQSKKGGYFPISYRRFGADVDALGTALINLGLQGKRIAIIGENRYEWSLAYLAAVCGVGIAVPLDRDLPEHEIQSLINRSEAGAVIFSPAVKPQIMNIKPSLKTVEYFISMDAAGDTVDWHDVNRILQRGHDLVRKGDRRFIDAAIDADATGILLFTSGTTDSSKAVMLSHRNICENLMALCSMVKLKTDDIFLSVLPIHHTYECTCGFLCPLYGGATVAYCEGLRQIPKNLRESKATIMLGVPQIYELMYRMIWHQAGKKGSSGKLRLALIISNLLGKIGIDITRKLFAEIHETFGGHLRLFICGAAAVDPEIAAGFRKFGILFLQGYGLTECSPIVTLNRDVDFQDASAGLVLPNLEIRIANPDDAGIGEICVKGPSVMRGYYQNDQETANVLKDGWFSTGDAGYIGKGGFLYITGRKKNVIVTLKGKNIYPEEIEFLIDQSPYIKESMVYGETDKVYDDVVIAAKLVPDLEKIGEEFPQMEQTAENLRKLLCAEIDAVNKKLGSYKRIKNIEVRETEFAKTSTRKIKRYLENKS